MAIKLPSPITVTAAQDTAIKAGINSVLTNATGIASIDLDKEAKSGLQTIDNIRYPYVQRTMTIHVGNYPQVLPPFLSLQDARANFDTINLCRNYKASLFKVIEQIDEISQVAENNVYEYLKKMYSLAKEAQSAGTVPGIQAFIDDIVPLFEKTLNEPTPPVVTPIV